MIYESKNVQTTPPAPTASVLLLSKLVGRPGTGSLPSSIAPPNHPCDLRGLSDCCNVTLPMK